MLKYSTEYLILNEESINWEKLSGDPEDYFSLVEIRLFRSKINWKTYLKSHIKSCPFTTQMLEVGSKYFDKTVYQILASFNIPTEDFIISHIDNFDIVKVIENCNVSQELLLEISEKWVDIENIKDSFKRAKFIDIDSPEFSDIKLLLEMK